MMTYSEFKKWLKPVLTGIETVINGWSLKQICAISNERFSCEKNVRNYTQPT